MTNYMKFKFSLQLNKDDLQNIVIRISYFTTWNFLIFLWLGIMKYVEEIMLIHHTQAIPIGKKIISHAGKLHSCTK